MRLSVASRALVFAIYRTAVTRSPALYSGAYILEGTCTMNLHTKADIARAKRVSLRTVDKWRARKLLPPPLKMGTAPQSRGRWTDEHLAILARNLGELCAASLTAE